MAGFRCSVCGRVHDELPMDIAYKRPAHFFAVPEDQRAARVYCTDDICVIDDRDFLVRGVLELPVAGTGDHFGWGVWALVDRADFVRYLQSWRAGTEDAMAPFEGTLSGGLQACAESDGLPVLVRPRGGGQRPRFVVRDDGHPLAGAQRDGITLAEAHGFVAP